MLYINKKKLLCHDTIRLKIAELDKILLNS